MNRKTLLLAAVFCLTPALASADPRDALLHSLRQCAGLTEAPERLACYDRLAPQFQPSTQAAAAPPAPPSRQEKESWFGLDNLFGGGEDKPQTTPQQFGEERVEKPPAQVEEAKSEEVESITAKLSDYAKNSYGKFIVFLDNGQVWAQISADTGKAHFAKDAKDNTVTIERAFMGSYSMTISDNTKLFKVKRLK
ncbi:MAG TPA: hypothetical protein VGM36_05240 [Rhizomicrobium sp.]|jgi:hypothetical protein